MSGQLAAVLRQLEMEKEFDSLGLPTTATRHSEW